MAGIEAVVWIDPPLLVERTFAGTTHDVRIAGLPTLLTIPVSGPNSLAGRPADPAPPIPVFPPPPLSEKPQFGTVTATLSIPVRDSELLVSAVRLNWSDPEYERYVSELEAVSEFVEEVGSWLSVVRNWLYGWDGDVRNDVFLPPPPLVRLVLVDQLQRGPIYGGGGPSQSLRSQISAQGRRVRAAFAASSTGKPFPLAHGLLYEARLDLARYDWRHSVINSCAAAEVAPSGVVRKHLIVTGHSKGEANDILDGVSGVMELFRLTAATPSTLGVTLDDVRKNLARPRNSAAHSGHPLDHNRAARAYRSRDR